jgi:hypothetical protein
MQSLVSENFSFSFLQDPGQESILMLIRIWVRTLPSVIANLFWLALCSTAWSIWETLLAIGAKHSRPSHSTDMQLGKDPIQYW